MLGAGASFRTMKPSAAGDNAASVFMAVNVLTRFSPCYARCEWLMTDNLAFRADYRYVITGRPLTMEVGSSPSNSSVRDSIAFWKTS